MQALAQTENAGKHVQSSQGFVVVPDDFWVGTSVKRSPKGLRNQKGELQGRLHSKADIFILLGLFPPESGPVSPGPYMREESSAVGGW